MQFADYKATREQWITFLESGIYPDALDAAILKYGPIIERFGELVALSKHSKDLFLRIVAEPAAVRTQLQRVFRKYVSPDTSVEMLKRVGDAESIVKNFGDRFRPLDQVNAAYNSRPVPDEALIAVLAEYETRGQKGYQLTEIFFDWFVSKHPKGYKITGPVSAGPDVPISNIFPDYPTANTVDVVIQSEQSDAVIFGYARYDSDRGGAQGLDRIASYGDKANEILRYADKHQKNIKLLLINDGPGLLLGRLWDRYAELESRHRGRLKVVTLKMLDAQLTPDWLG